MKDEGHHLKHIQKRVLRSERRKSMKVSEDAGATAKTIENDGAQVLIYDEFVSHDQQVSRVPTRLTYH